MKIKDEWRVPVLNAVRWNGLCLTVSDVDAALEAVAPLIAQDVIDACAAVVDGFTWCPSTVGALIRREVPKLLFGEAP